MVTVQAQRSQFYQGEGAMPEDVLQALLKKFGLGWWGVNLRLYGYDEINEVNARIITEAFAKYTKQEFAVSKWHKGEPLDNSGAGVPTVAPLQAVNWRGRPWSAPRIFAWCCRLASTS